MLIYLHIPFCDSKCHYCAFNSYVDKFEFKTRYMKSIIKQLHYELDLFKPARKSIKSLFIGGGTPSSIKPELYKNFFEVLSPFLAKNAEITCEANPNSSSLQWLESMKNLGVNRISFGVQSFDDKKLDFLGRNHSKEIAVNAIKNAKSVGFKNISLDLIYGTIFDNKDLLIKDLEIARTLPINHISAYSLTIEENTPFYKIPNVAKDSFELARFFIQNIKDFGFPQYEISNFGIYQSVHNLGYWNQEDYIGIGAGAVGFLKNRRFYPAKKIEAYIDNPLQKDVENLSMNELKTEAIFLGLRSKIGIKLEILNKKELEKIYMLIDEKKLFKDEKKVYNPNYFLADEIALYIYG